MSIDMNGTKCSYAHKDNHVPIPSSGLSIFMSRAAEVEYIILTLQLMHVSYAIYECGNMTF